MKKKLFFLYVFLLSELVNTTLVSQDKVLINNDQEAFDKEWEKTLHTLQKIIPEKIAEFIKKIEPDDFSSDLYQKFTELMSTTIKDRFHKLEHTFYQYKKILQEKLHQILTQVNDDIAAQKQHTIYGKDPSKNKDWILVFESAQPAILLVMERFKNHE